MQSNLHLARPSVYRGILPPKCRDNVSSHINCNSIYGALQYILLSCLPPGGTVNGPLTVLQLLRIARCPIFPRTCLLEMLRRLVRKAFSFWTLSLVLILERMAAVFCSDLGGWDGCWGGRIAGCIGMGWFWRDIGWLFTWGSLIRAKPKIKDSSVTRSWTIITIVIP